MADSKPDPYDSDGSVELVASGINSKLGKFLGYTEDGDECGRGALYEAPGGFLHFVPVKPSRKRGRKSYALPPSKKASPSPSPSSPAQHGPSASRARTSEFLDEIESLMYASGKAGAHYKVTGHADRALNRHLKRMFDMQR